MMVERNPDSRPPISIPVYTIPDIVLRADAADFALQRLEMTFANIHRHVPAHRHDHYQVWWITGGRGGVTVNTRQYTITPPMLYYLSPGQVHTACFSAALSGYSIRFTRAFLLSNAYEQTKLAQLMPF